MSNFSAVMCYEVPETLSVDFDAVTGEVSASVDLSVPWSQRWALVGDLLNNSRPLPDYGNGAPVALKAAVKSTGERIAFGQSFVYSDATVSVSYGIRKFEQVGPFDIVAESIEPQAEFRILPYNNFRWGSKTGDPLVEAEAPGKLEVKLMLVRQIFKVPTPLPLAALTAAGAVHNAEYASPLLGLTFPEETLLYLEPKFDRTLQNSGAAGVNYTQQWAIKPTGWNKFFRAKTGTYEEIYQTTDAGTDPYKNYDPQDLSGLLA
jgi:hypothetical protein